MTGIGGEPKHPDIGRAVQTFDLLEERLRTGVVAHYCRAGPQDQAPHLIVWFDGGMAEYVPTNRLVFLDGGDDVGAG